MTRVVGFDASLTGSCLYDGSEFLYLKNVGKPSAPIDRIRSIRDAALEFILDGTEDTEVWLEDYAFNARGNQAHAIGELGGVLKLGLLDHGVFTYLVKPNLRAKFGSGKGNASKDAVVSSVSARTGIIFETNDHCDCYILHCMGMEANGQPHGLGKLPQTHTDALKKAPVFLS